MNKNHQLSSDCTLLECDLCQRAFSRSDLLESHNRLFHPFEKGCSHNNCDSGKKFSGQNSQLRLSSHGTVNDNRPTPIPSTATPLRAAPKSASSHPMVSPVIETASLMNPKTKKFDQNVMPSSVNSREYELEFERWLQEEDKPPKIRTQSEPERHESGQKITKILNNVGQNPIQNLSKLSPPLLARQEILKKSKKVPKKFQKTPSSSYDMVVWNKESQKVEKNPKEGQCKICGWTGQSGDSHWIHLMMIHLGDSGKKLNSRTEICSKNLNINNGTNQPVTEPPSTLFDCRLCQRWFSDVQMYERHLTTFHPRSNSLQSATCGGEDKEKSRMTENYFEFACQSCKKSLRLKSVQEATAQKRRHGDNDLVPFKCRYCLTIFPAGYFRTSHGKIHRGDKPVTCTKCLNRFATIYNLRRHLRNVHKEIVNKKLNKFC